MKHRSKKRLILVFIYSLLTFFILYFLNTKLHPQDIKCPVHNTKQRIVNKLSNQLETNAFAYFTKYMNYNLSKKGWTEITKNIYVYSAFLETCPSTISSSLCILLIGMTYTNATTSLPPLNCAVMKDSDIIYAGFSTIEILPEDHSKAYSAAYFYCDLKSFSKDDPSPEFVTLYTTSISTWIPIEYIKSSFSDIKVSLCVRPLYGSYSSLYLSEFLSYYSSMGVDHFIFYHQNISDSKYTFLKFLKAANLSVEVLLWDIPLSNDLIHEYGQIVFSQDCTVRSKYRFTHTIIVDLDEFIVPKMHSSIKDLILYLDKKYPNAGSYIIPMVMFCEEFSIEEASSFSLIKSNKRQKTPWAHGFRSKYILKPDRVHSVGIHFIWKHAQNWIEINLSDSVVLLHHYRLCCGVLQSYFLHLFTFPVLKDEVVIDNSLINHAANHILIASILRLANLTSIQAIIA